MLTELSEKETHEEMNDLPTVLLILVKELILQVKVLSLFTHF